MQHGNPDAQDRLAALSQPDPSSLSRQQHEVLTETTLVRKRTQAKQRSDASGQRPAGRPDGKKIMDNVRKGSLMMPAVPENQENYPPSIPQMPSMPSIPQQQQQPPQPKPQKQQSLAPTPQPASQPPPQSAYPPGQRPLPGGFKFANSPRYSLVDPGSRPASSQELSGPGQAPPKKTESSDPGRRPTPQQNRPSGQQPGQPGPDQGPPKPKPSNSPQPIVSTLPPPGTGFDQGPYNQKPYKGAQTFQEMGIATAKVEDRECVIM